MAVVAVGDFDKAKIEELIKKHFGPLAVPPGAPPRPAYPIPDHDETLFAVAADKEATQSVVAVYHKLPLAEQSTVGAYRRMLVERLFNDMLNDRLSEIAQKPDPPFLGAVSSRGRFVGTKDVYVLSALVGEGGIPRGLRALYTEGERVARFGFTATELERRKSESMRYFERAVTEKETQDSGAYAEEFTRAFLEGEPTPGIQFEYDLHKQYMPGISARRGERAGPGVDDRPEPGHHGQPAGEAGRRGAHRGRARRRPRGGQERGDRPLRGHDDRRAAPRRGPRARHGRRPARDRRDRGDRVDALERRHASSSSRPTFKEDEILFRALSAGGISLAEDRSLVPANTADQVVAAGGLGEFSAVNLEKKLAGKAVQIRPSIDELEEGLSGNASPKDAEIALRAHPPDLHRAAPRPGRLRRHQDPAQDLPREPHAEPGVGLLGHPADDDAERPAPLPAHDGRRDPRDEPREIAGLLPRPLRRRERLHVLLRRQPGPGEDRAARLHLPGLAALDPPQGDLEGLARAAARGRRQEDGREGRRAQEPDGHRLLRAVREQPREPRPHPGRRPGARRRGCASSCARS
ncbi:MAG: insulinase family protein [Desulfobacterales bacterium]|nr:insulinase family protein [Desulfobacterales bacterium]